MENRLSAQSTGAPHQSKSEIVRHVARYFVKKRLDRRLLAFEPNFSIIPFHMVIRMRVNRSKVGKRRSHHALKASRLITCECGKLRQNHRACPSCGKYGGRVVVDVVARAKRDANRTKRREKSMRAAGLAQDAAAAVAKETPNS